MMRQPCRPDTSVALALVALLLLGPLPANCLSNVPAGADVQEDNGQVTINPDPTSNSTTPAELPTTATIFSGVPGPSRCRGTVVLRLSVPPPLRDENGQVQKGERRCYNHLQPVGCGNFVASKEAGCEARLFAEPNCQMYLNTAVFVPEDRAVGGRWRSIEVQCGIPAPDPDTLGQPPLQGLIRNKKTGG
ncbi:hypothetical protein QBC42DRAFT_281126 [Cladorrhinum samala]|uniref:Uncharacterized protein n=1 Tax=Cladorrhinum samala TaxID=585594 RepID=A0AAV9H9B0_9PEZI|nr:hypothetical protein QBC42DRAFT_281126 [Cladorrhinum samala]